MEGRKRFDCGKLMFTGLNRRSARFFQARFGQFERRKKCDAKLAETLFTAIKQPNFVPMA